MNLELMVLQDVVRMCYIEKYIEKLHKEILTNEKIAFPNKPDIQTYIHTEGRIFAFIE